MAGLATAGGERGPLEGGESLPWVALRLHLEHGQGGKSWGGVGGGRVGSIALGSGIAGIGTEVQSTKAFVE